MQGRSSVSQGLKRCNDKARMKERTRRKATADVSMGLALFTISIEEKIVDSKLELLA
jgi:hypothetical protein